MMFLKIWRCDFRPKSKTPIDNGSKENNTMAEETKTATPKPVDSLALELGITKEEKTKGGVKYATFRPDQWAVLNKAWPDLTPGSVTQFMLRAAAKKMEKKAAGAK